MQIAGKCIRDRMNYIVFEKVEYPVREIWINEYKNVMRISSEDLNDVLLDSTGNYKTREAKMVDEQIFFFVPRSMIINCGDEEIEQYIYGSL